MKRTLQLIIKQKHLDDILSGTKKEEVREITPTTAQKYCDLDDEGNFVKLKKFDSLLLHVGYNKGRKSVEVEVLGEELEILQDEKGNDITYEHEGEEMLMCNVVYSLGKILSDNKAGG